MNKIEEQELLQRVWDLEQNHARLIKYIEHTDNPYVNLEYMAEEDRLRPTRAHEYDAGLDLFANDDYLLTAGERTLVNTGVRVKIPRGYVGLLVPRSSLSKQRNIVMTNSIGIIDSDYRGDIMASLCYLGSTEPQLKDWIDHTHINKYDKIVQLVIVPIKLTKLIVGKEYTWPDTERGIGGFGSTGA